LALLQPRACGYWAALRFFYTVIAVGEFFFGGYETAAVIQTLDIAE